MKHSPALPRPTNDPGAVPALDRALDILEALSRHGGSGLTLSELSAALALPKNAVFRITHTLAARGYLTRDEATKRFSLTTKLLTIGQPRIRDVSLAEVALGPMRRLRDLTRETVQLGVRSDAEGVIIEKVEGLHHLRIAVDLGLRFKFYNNAPGKVLLAYRPTAERDALIAGLDLVANTSRTITDPAELRRECDRVVAQGYSTDWAEADEGLHCVAAPVLDRHGELVAALWVSAPSRRLPHETFPEVGRRVRQAADEVSRAIQE
jgi:DNA-binding IclR family transcriptional regulator